LPFCPDQPGAAISNGYVGAWVPRGLPGSAGPPVAAVELVKGVFQADDPIDKERSIFHVHLSHLPSWTITASVSKINGAAFPATASALDTSRHCYLVASSPPDGQPGSCVQTTYAHRSRPHVVVSEFECTNPPGATRPMSAVIAMKSCNASWVYASLCPASEAAAGAVSFGPSQPFDLGFQVEANTPVACSVRSMKAPETPTTPLPVFAECHTEIPSEGVTLSTKCREKD
jgi:hypothetical protein